MVNITNSHNFDFLIWNKLKIIFKITNKISNKNAKIITITTILITLMIIISSIGFYILYNDNKMISNDRNINLAEV